MPGNPALPVPPLPRGVVRSGRPRLPPGKPKILRPRPMRPIPAAACPRTGPRDGRSAGTAARPGFARTASKSSVRKTGSPVADQGGHFVVGLDFKAQKPGGNQSVGVPLHFLFAAAPTPGILFVEVAIQRRGEKFMAGFDFRIYLALFEENPLAVAVKSQPGVAPGIFRPRARLKRSFPRFGRCHGSCPTGRSSPRNCAAAF